MYYWDSYFTMLGLRVSHKDVLIHNIVDNFVYLIKTYGHIPNGTRTYYLSRSQPPFFSLMVELLVEANGNKEYINYLPSLQAEYDFWMDGANKLNTNSPARDRVVLLDDKTILNRYWDNDSTPRAEAYKEDIALAAQVNSKPEVTYRNIRAACESGWDFSARWFLDGTRMSTIRTTEIIPVDLNCLLYNLEKVLANAYEISGDRKKSELFINKAEARKNAIIKYCWDKDSNFFTDYDFTRKKPTGIYSLAGMYPFYFSLAEQEHADKAAILLEKYFLFPGGLLSDLMITGQQWDAPNGWAPLNWIAYKGLKNYKHDMLANTIRNRWLQNVKNEYKRTGKLIEKYNVLYPEMPGSGGEYPSQDGFGWTNGIYLKMLKE
jgi:alpha,alpha-trehalase